MPKDIREINLFLQVQKYIYSYLASYVRLDKWKTPHILIILFIVPHIV